MKFLDRVREREGVVPAREFSSDCVVSQQALESVPLASWPCRLNRNGRREGAPDTW